MPKEPKSPQEKKRLSLEHDRRNIYGENDKASRKNIPRSKAKSHRAVRRTAKQVAASLEQYPDAKADALESTIAKRSLQKGDWKKSPDEPLGHVIKRQARARTSRDGRKARSGIASV